MAALKSLHRALQPALAGSQWRGIAGAAAAVAMDDPVEAITDLCRPASFFPVARALQRHVVAHLGPTNSGKTYEALQDLRRAASGVYAGPLRLLAWQVHDQLNSAGLPCNMVTGQERREMGARHTACTTEMASTRAVVDVGVIDEVQMLADESRGWAFTRALLGIPARTLHVCGDPAVLPLLKRIVDETGDSLEVRRYERLSPLQAARRPLTCLSQVQRGDCIVSFSRRQVHAIRQQVEQMGKHKCAVVYGALPPEARQQQAHLFNTPRTGFNVLSASDAVGMGLNLAIRRVVFTSLRKFDGQQERQLTTAEIKQVAGRAGRFGSQFPDGIVTALDPADLALLAHELEQPSEELATAFLFPSLSQLELLHGQYPQDKLPGILHRFADAAQSSLEQTHYSYARYDEVHTLATMLRHLPLSLREAWTFAISPTDPDDVPVASALLGFATTYAARRQVTPAAILLAPLAEARSELELQQLEASHRILDLYLWLAYRFLDAFTGLEEVQERRSRLAALVDSSITAMGAQRTRKGRQDEAAPNSVADAEALFAALEQQRMEEWEQRRGSYRKKQRR